MSYYRRHVFFCLNERQAPEACCACHGAAEMQAYAKQRVKALGLSGKVLVVLSEPTGDGAVEKSFRNIADVKIAYAGGLGTYDVLWADRVLLTTAAIDALEGLSTEKQGSTPEQKAGSSPDGNDGGEAS